MASSTDGNSQFSPDMSELSEEERLKVLDVLKRAQVFLHQEEKHSLRQPLQGQLSKYTNMMKGWQYRYFVLEPTPGRLSYFEKEEHKTTQRPRGSINLTNAVVYPSEEDYQTFHVNASNGVSFQLKAIDTKERQCWIDRLRATVEYHNEIYRKNNLTTENALWNEAAKAEQKSNSTPCLLSLSDEIKNSSDSESTNTLTRKKTLRSEIETEDSDTIATPPVEPANINDCTTSISTLNMVESFKSAKDMLNNVNLLNKALIKATDFSPSIYGLSMFDKDLLNLKAISSANVKCLEDCFMSLVDYKDELLRNAGQPSRQTKWYYPLNSNQEGDDQSTDSLLLMEPADFQEIEDDSEEDENIERGSESSCPVPVDILSKLKLGADLTKVTLPAYILDKKSLLEMFADCNSNPQLFLGIADEKTARDRMEAVVKWYLTTFKGAIKNGKINKPYNPIIGENFHCQWSVDNTTLSFTAEQVSHHPPISAFFMESKQKRISLNSSVWTKISFHGMSVGISLVGNIKIRLDEFDEEYLLTYPSIYVKSLLTNPLIELGDKVSIKCPKSGYNATLEFSTRNQAEERVHFVNGEIREPENSNVIMKINGEWKNSIKFVKLDGDNKEYILDLKEISTFKKRVRPIESQNDKESRKVWRDITQSLRKNDFVQANKLKTKLENSQRAKDTSKSFTPKYFQHIKEKEWFFKNS
ncbi:DgyrCDS14196 [Dimorphilus gyrociliatus]|uniref:Oxysterol-binding protein n=1 Tax=Dimorphilus gyrociliatus TaxID=2664684 RepID=A0A7I8WD31_9ANNE|nr:DgyrCDS14196 [Dimorphilus gyrociliatus]